MIARAERRWGTRASFRGSDDGSASILAVALVGAVLTIAMILLPLCQALVARQIAANAADAAALAAADTASGLIPGVPCDAAGRAASVNGAELASCAIDGITATVSVRVGVLAFVASASARAGPPP